MRIQDSILQCVVAGYIVFLGASDATNGKKPLAPLVSARDPSLIIPGKYIVVLDETSSMADDEFRQVDLDDHQTWLMTLIGNSYGEDVKIEHKFNIEGLRGYTGKFTEGIVEAIRGRPEVKYVEPDQLVYALDMIDGRSRRTHVKEMITKKSSKYSQRKPYTTRPSWEKHGRPKVVNKVLKQLDAPWGLSRVSHGEMPVDLSKYHYPRSSGKKVDVYVIDTGINIAHDDFGGRARWGVTIPDDDIDIDGNGHGTHCAGTIAGYTYGIAKKANVVAVKVLRTNGFGTNGDVIKGIEWTIRSAQRGKRQGRQAVANMSLGGGRSITLEHAVNRAVAFGLHFAVAAGNDNEDACDYSPAAAKGPITVGASTNRDTMAFFSNHGPCVDIFAPGMDITSTWIGTRRAVNTISGTSMASPHVAGVLALYLGERSYEPSELKEIIIQDANRGLLEDIPYNTENRLLSTSHLLKGLGFDN